MASHDGAQGFVVFSVGNVNSTSTHKATTSNSATSAGASQLRSMVMDLLELVIRESAHQVFYEKEILRNILLMGNSKLSISNVRN